MGIERGRGIKMMVAAACLAAAGAMGAGFSWPGQAVPDAKLIDPGAPVEGPATAAAVIVEFSDFQCPYCAGMFAYVNGLRRQAPEGVRVVWMDRPLNGAAGDGFPFHPYSMIAHEAGCEAAAQGKFGALQAWVFSNQLSLFPSGRPADQADYEARQGEVKKKLVEACAELGIDKARMEAALDDHRWEATVEKRLEMARRLKINVTPTVYVNGHEIGADPDEVRKAVGKALGKGL
ncbi:MAG TPA: thioredoxin domain-containing protein [bacterium]|nr:thioredoxin domain-containing protein [bacterium]